MRFLSFKSLGRAGTKPNGSNNLKLINRRNNSVNNPGEEIAQQSQSLSIFKRFKEAYRQHGKILIWVHVLTCMGWMTGFFPI